MNASHHCWDWIALCTMQRKYQGEKPSQSVATWPRTKCARQLNNSICLCPPPLNNLYILDFMCWWMSLNKEPKNDNFISRQMLSRHKLWLPPLMLYSIKASVKKIVHPSGIATATRFFPMPRVKKEYPNSINKVNPESSGFFMPF